MRLKSWFEKIGSGMADATWEAPDVPRYNAGYACPICGALIAPREAAWLQHKAWHLKVGQ